MLIRVYLPIYLLTGAVQVERMEADGFNMTLSLAALSEPEEGDLIPPDLEVFNDSELSNQAYFASDLEIAATVELTTEPNSEYETAIIIPDTSVAVSQNMEVACGEAEVSEDPAFHRPVTRSSTVQPRPIVDPTSTSDSDTVQECGKWVYNIMNLIEM